MVTEYQPAFDLLAIRRRTNGYANIWELCEACGIDSTNLCSPEVLALANVLRASNRVAIRGPIGDEVTEYRLLA